MKLNILSATVLAATALMASASFADTCDAIGSYPTTSQPELSCLHLTQELGYNVFKTKYLNTYTCADDAGNAQQCVECFGCVDASDSLPPGY